MVEKSGHIFSTAWKHLTSLNWNRKELVGDSKLQILRYRQICRQYGLSKTKIHMNTYEEKYWWAWKFAFNLLFDIFYQSFILFRKQAYTENEHPAIVWDCCLWIAVL